MNRKLFYSIALLIVFVLAACEPLSYNPTPIMVVITEAPTETMIPTSSPTPTITPTASPSLTPFTPSPTPFPCTEETGQFNDIDDNPSEIGRGENLRYRVYVPPCYFSTQKRFPVAYLIHGLSFREEQWEDLGINTALEQGIRIGAMPPMILVMPFMGNLGQRNSFPPDPSYEGFILEELMPAIERNFCTIENPEHRAIGGISRGGFWAFSITMRHPDIFSIVGGHSAFFPNDAGEIPPAFNPLELALNESFLQSIDLRIWLDNGVADSVGSSQQLFSSRLTQRNIDHTYVVHPSGKHDNSYWEAHIQEYLTFYGRTWERDYGLLPNCTEPSP
jgi:enterochelin esterase-like enzyme